MVGVAVELDDVGVFSGDKNPAAVEVNDCVML
jgi:hypothetical protein